MDHTITNQNYSISNVPERDREHFAKGDLRFGSCVPSASFYMYGDGWGTLNLYLVVVNFDKKTYKVEFSFGANARHDRKKEDIPYENIEEVPNTTKQIKAILYPNN